MQQIYEFIANKQTFSRVFMLFLCYRGIERSGKTNETVRWLQRIAVEKQTLHQFGVGKGYVGEFSQRNP